MAKPQDDTALLGELFKHYGSCGYKIERSETALGLRVVTAKKPASDVHSGQPFDLSVVAVEGTISGIRTRRIFPPPQSSVLSEALVAGERSPVLYSLLTSDVNGNTAGYSSLAVFAVSEYHKSGLLGNTEKPRMTLFGQLSIPPLGGGEFWVYYQPPPQIQERDLDYLLWFDMMDGFGESCVVRTAITGEDKKNDPSFNGTINPAIGTIDENRMVLVNGRNGEPKAFPRAFPSAIYRQTLDCIDDKIRSASDWIRLPMDFPFM